MMNGPAQVFDRLIDAQAVFPTLGGPEAIVLDFQAPKHPHARLGQGVALDVLMLEISGHLLEVVLQEREDLLEVTFGHGLDLDLLEGFEGVVGLLLIAAVAEDIPDPFHEGAQLPYLGIGLHDLDQLLLLLGAHPLIGLKQQIALLPEGVGQCLQLISVPGGADLLASGLDLPAVGQGILPQLLPDILEDMEVVILDEGLRVDGLDGILEGLVVIDIEGLNSQPQSLHPLQKRLHLGFLLCLDLLGSNDTAMLILQHQHTIALSPSREVAIEVALGDELPAVELLDDDIGAGQSFSHIIDPAIDGGFA